MSEVEIGGRRFKVIDFDRRTALNDSYLRKLVRATGADKVIPEQGEGDTEYLVRLQCCITDSLRAHELVAGLLVDPGQDETEFTVEQAASIAAHIAKSNSPEDRALVHELSMRAVLDFFREGLSSLLRFRIFSGSVEVPDQSPETPSPLPA